MSSFKGYNFTVSDQSAAPARKRFTDPQAVYDVYDALKNEDSKDADRRAKIRAVMRWAGPRMLFVHPVLAVRHLLETRKEKQR